MIILEWLTTYSDYEPDLILQIFIRLIETLIAVGIGLLVAIAISGILKNVVRNYIPRFLSTGTDDERAKRTKSVISGIVRFLTIFQWGIWVWFILLTIMFEAGLWSDINQNHFWFAALLRFSKVILILIGIELVLTSVNFAIDRWVEFIRDEDPEHSDAERRAKTVSYLLKSTFRYVLSFVGFLMIFRELGLDIGPALAGAGVLGLAIGFGAQTLVKDVISGFFVLFEGQYHVGDFIKVGSVMGTVERMALRVTIIRSYDGTLHIIQNSQVTPVSIMSRGYSRAIVEIGVTYNENIDKLREALSEIVEDFKHPDILEPVSVLGVTDLGDFDVKFRIAVRTKPLGHWGIEREIRQSVKRGLDERGIEIPFPQQVVHYVPIDKDDAKKSDGEDIKNIFNDQDEIIPE